MCLGKLICKWWGYQRNGVHEVATGKCHAQRACRCDVSMVIDFVCLSIGLLLVMDCIMVCYCNFSRYMWIWSA